MTTMIDNKLEALALLNSILQGNDPDLAEVILEAGQHNPWFTPHQVNKAIRQLGDAFLDPERLRQWLRMYGYPLTKTKTHKVGLVMAGNIPLVGFHDFLCVWLSGHHAMIKLSEKDAFLLPWMLDQLVEMNPAFQNDWTIVERLQGFDAVIATGSNNSARYFEAYFGSYPHIIRKNRNGVAVVDGNESTEQLQLLATDILTYFGLGCRNVAKLFVPAGYDFKPLLDVVSNFPELQDHNRYRNNYDYQYALAIMNQVPHYTTGHLLCRQSSSLLSPMATLHYEEYAQESDLLDKLRRDEEAIQCIVTDLTLPGLNTIALGSTQQPGLSDYADGVDVMQFLIQLHGDA